MNHMIANTPVQTITPSNLNPDIDSRWEVLAPSTNPAEYSYNNFHTNSSRNMKTNEYNFKKIFHRDNFKFYYCSTIELGIVN